MTDTQIGGVPVSRSAREMSISEVAERAINVWNDHDMRAFAELFSESAVFVNEEGHRWATRHQIERELSTRHESLFRASRLSAVETQVTVLAPTVAAVQVRWELVRIISQNGSSLPHRAGFLLLILALEADVWKISVGQNTRSQTAEGEEGPLGR